MAGDSPVIVFLDNSIQNIFRVVETLKKTYRETYAFNNETEGLDFIFSRPVELIFLNLDLTPHDAVSLSREIRLRKSEERAYIVIYSDKQDEFLHELAYNAGADSFVNFHNKPAILELFVRNLLKRRQAKIAHDNRSIVLDKERFLIFKKGVPFQLPKKEFRVFELLYDHPHKFFSKSEIAEEVWKDGSVASKRTIDVHIYNIRQLFGKSVIQSQKGKGYRINARFL